MEMMMKMLNVKRGVVLGLLCILSGVHFESVLSEPLWTCAKTGPWDVDQDHPVDRIEMERLAVAMKSHAWLENKHWLNRSVSMCEWQLVCCTVDERGLNRILELHLERNNLNGSFPGTFFKMERVQWLSFNDNLVQNFPPNMAKMTQLQQAKFGRNPICGKLPASFSRLKNLRKLNCNFCCLHGRISGYLWKHAILGGDVLGRKRLYRKRA